MMMKNTRRLRALIALTALCSVSACHTSPHYIVTSAPLNVGGGPAGLCIAINPSDEHGIWWWEPGPSGCATRSTGPDVFHAEDATVTAAGGNAAVEARFRLALHPRAQSTAPNVVDVRLTIQDSMMACTSTGARVSTERRSDLKIPART